MMDSFGGYVAVGPNLSSQFFAPDEPPDPLADQLPPMADQLPPRAVEPPAPMADKLPPPPAEQDDLH